MMASASRERLSSDQRSLIAADFPDLALNESYLRRALELVQHCGKLKDVPGGVKLLRRCLSELKFVQSVYRADDAEKLLKSTNLSHLEALMRVLECHFQKNSSCQLLQTFSLPEDAVAATGQSSVLVHLVCHSGALWVKVVARNPDALEANWSGDTEFGTRSIVHQVEELLLAASAHHVYYRPPRVLVYFTNGVTSPVRDALINLGALVQVEGEPHLVISLPHQHSQVYNLDITALITMCTQLCQPGGADHHFKDPVLTKMAMEECQDPALPPLLQLFTDEDALLVCESAWKEFHDIVRTIGGAQEQSRAKNLLKRVRMVADNPSNAALSLRSTRTVKSRNKIIFGTGDSHKAVTVTANRGFVRAARNQGVNFVIFLHSARALTENEEIQE